MKNLINNLKNRKAATIFLIVGITIGISILSFNISYTEALRNKSKISGVKDQDYLSFIVGSSKQFNMLNETILDLKKNMYINVSTLSTSEKQKYNLVGVAFEKKPLYQHKISGQFFTLKQVNSDENIAIVGRSLKDNVYKKDNKNYIMIQNVEFEVIGTSNETSYSNSVLLPINVFLKLTDNIELNNFKFFVISKDINENIVYDSINDLLDKGDRIIDLKENAYEPSNNILLVLSMIVITIAVINIINFSVLWISQRKKEIALRKTVGATNLDIRNLILSEILTLSVTAAIISLIVQVIIYSIINSLYILDFGLYISFENLLVSMLMAMLISIISSIPAYKETTKIYPAMILKEE